MDLRFLSLMQMAFSSHHCCTLIRAALKFFAAAAFDSPTAYRIASSAKHSVERLGDSVQENC